MPKFIKRRSKKAGLPPGTLVHIGEKKTEEVKITLIDYNEDSFQEKEVENIEECFPFRDKPTVTWINIEGLHKVDVIGRLGKHFGLHPLVMEDILNTDQRPKMEDFEKYIYMVLKMLYNGSSMDIASEQLSLILGQNFVISFQEGIEGDIFNTIRERIRTGKGRIRKMGADYLAYSLMDATVDNYFVILERIGEKIELIQETLVSNPSSDALQTMHNLKKDIIFLRKSIWPLREMISNMQRVEVDIIAGSTKIYLRDVYDHTIQVIDAIESFRDLLSGMHDIYLSSISNRLNEIMKVLTMISTVFIPLTFIGGIYGMNFRFMPELESHWGYPLVLIVMAAIAISLVAFFRKRKWI